MAQNCHNRVEIEELALIRHAQSIGIPLWQIERWFDAQEPQTHCALWHLLANLIRAITCATFLELF